MVNVSIDVQQSYKKAKSHINVADKESVEKKNYQKIYVKLDFAPHTPIQDGYGLGRQARDGGTYTPACGGRDVKSPTIVTTGGRNWFLTRI